MDPKWIFQQYQTEFVWIALVIIVVECGLFFPFLPGDTLLFSVGLFIASSGFYHLDLNLFVAIVLFTVAAFAGNVLGYEIGRWIGPPLYERDGRILKKKYFDNTTAFFDKHGNKALVIGRFVPFVRTYITVVAGVTRMARRRFFLWSAVGRGPLGHQHHPARLLPRTFVPQPG
jgi:membrane-associated protein